MQVVTVNVTQWQFAAVCEALRLAGADPQAAVDARLKIAEILCKTEQELTASETRFVVREMCGPRPATWAGHAAAAQAAADAFRNATCATTGFRCGK